MVSEMTVPEMTVPEVAVFEVPMAMAAEDERAAEEHWRRVDRIGRKSICPAKR
jgi:hypothetical protein